MIAYCTFPYVWPGNRSSPDPLGILWILTSRKSERVIRDIRSCDRVSTRFSKAISLMTFHFSPSQPLMWTRAVLKIANFLLRRPMTPENQVRQNPDLFIRIPQSLPPPTPEVMAYLASAALKPFFSYRINPEDRLAPRNCKNTLKTVKIKIFWTFIPGRVHMFSRPK